jgi:hypothetical protein
MHGLGSARNRTDVSHSGDAVCGAMKQTPLLSVNQRPWYLESGPEMGRLKQSEWHGVRSHRTLRCTFYVPGAARKESLVTWVCANRWKTRD